MNFKELRQQSGMTQQKFADYFSIPKRTIENWEAGVNKCPEYLLDLMKYKLEQEGKKDIKSTDTTNKEKKNKTVYVVLWGEDCEGAQIEGVFTKKEDAIKLIKEKYPSWQEVIEDEWRKTYIRNGKICKHCTSVFIEEWDVN